MGIIRSSTIVDVVILHGAMLISINCPTVPNRILSEGVKFASIDASGASSVKGLITYNCSSMT